MILGEYSKRNNMISTTAGSNIIHSSPYNFEQYSNQVMSEESAYSNPLDILESFKQTALDELMRKHNIDKTQNRVHISGPVSISQNSKLQYENIQNNPYNQDQYENNNFRSSYSPQKPNYVQTESLQARIQNPVNSFEETPWQQQYQENSDQHQNEVDYEEQKIEKKSELRTTKPPKQTKGKPLKKNEKENNTISQENYHYAKEKLKKDQERLKQSSKKCEIVKEWMILILREIKI